MKISPVNLYSYNIYFRKNTGLSNKKTSPKEQNFLTDEEFQEIKKLKNKSERCQDYYSRYTEEKIKEDAFNHLKEYENFENLPFEKQVDWVYLNEATFEFSDPYILKKEDVEKLPPSSTLFRFKYIQDLKKSNSDDEFIKSTRYKIFKNSLKYINNPYIQDFAVKNEGIHYTQDVLDAINISCGRFSKLNWVQEGNYKSSYGSFDIYLKQNYNTNISDFINKKVPILISCEFLEVPSENFAKDAELLIKYKELKNCLLFGHNDKMKEYLYKNYYLENIQKDINVSPKVIEKCKKINSKYGTKVILSSYTEGLEEALDYLDKEFDKFKKASNHEAKLPKVISINLAQSDWYNAFSAKGVGTTAARMSRFGELNIPVGREIYIKRFLQHEIVHLNHVEYDYEYKKQEKRDAIFNKLKDTGEYRSEFKKAGINSEKIFYAGIDRRELIAVASEGDTSKYSNEFKENLIELGMPEWIFKLENN